MISLYPPSWPSNTRWPAQAGKFLRHLSDWLIACLLRLLRFEISLNALFRISWSSAFLVCRREEKFPNWTIRPIFFPYCNHKPIYLYLLLFSKTWSLKHCQVTSDNGPHYDSVSSVRKTSCSHSAHTCVTQEYTHWPSSEDNASHGPTALRRQPMAPSPTPQRTVLEKMIVAQLVEEVPSLHKSQMCNTVFATAHHRRLFSTRWIQSTSLNKLL
jgi:hypothetical protein